MPKTMCQYVKINAKKKATSGKDKEEEKKRHIDTDFTTKNKI